MATKRFNLPCWGTVLAGVAALWLAAPASRAQKPAEAAAEDRQKFRESVLAIRGQIDTTLEALAKIGQGSDAGARKSALKEYSKEIEAMSKQIDKTREYSQKMKERGHAYFKEWEKKMKAVTNEALRASAEKRRTALVAQYEKIESGIAQAKDDSATFWQNLQDLQKYYTTDLSNDAITNSAELVQTTTADGKKIQGYIDEVVKAVDAVGAVVEQPAAKEAEQAGLEAEPEGAEPEEAEPDEEPPEDEDSPGRASS